MNTEQNNNHSSENKGGKKPTVEQALLCLDRLADTFAAKSMEKAFIEALQGKDVREIGRYQVYSDYCENETVVFIHEPTGRSNHKYIFAVADGHTYIVAAPMEWTDYHREILVRVSAASGTRAICPGGGYVEVLSDGTLRVDRSSVDFGQGDHQRAKKALEDAVRRTGERQGTH
jgi:hypothetical protein